MRTKKWKRLFKKISYIKWQVESSGGGASDQRQGTRKERVVGGTGSRRAGSGTRGGKWWEVGTGGRGSDLAACPFATAFSLQQCGE